MTSDCNEVTYRLDRRAVLAMMLGVTAVTLDISLTSTAIPAIAKGLGTSPALTIWIINLYYLAVVAALLPMAALGEIIGHRKVYLFGLLVFFIGCLCSGLSGSLGWLMVGKGLVGFGAAAVSATTPALIKFVYPPSRLSRGVGLYAMVVGIAFTAGPTMTSVILSMAAWPWIFFFGATIALLAAGLAWRYLPVTELNARPFDGVAALLCALMFACLLTAISSLGHLRWSVGVVAGAVTFLAAYLLSRREAGQSSPVLALDLFRIRLFRLSALTAVCAFVVQGMVFVALPMLLMFDLGYSQIQAGFMITPWPATLALMTVIAARLCDRWSPGLLGGVGMLMVSAGLVLIVTLPGTADVFDIAWRLVLCGVGFSLFQSPNMVALMNSAPRHRSGSAGGIVASARLIGQSVGATTVAFCLSVWPGEGLHTAFWIGAVAALLGAVFSSLRLMNVAQDA